MGECRNRVYKRGDCRLEQGIADKPFHEDDETKCVLVAHVGCLPRVNLNLFADSSLLASAALFLEVLHKVLYDTAKLQ